MTNGLGDRAVPQMTTRTEQRLVAALKKKHGSNYNLVRETQQTRIPGRTVVVGGKKVYQQ